MALGKVTENPQDLASLMLSQRLAHSVWNGLAASR